MAKITNEERAKRAASYDPIYESLLDGVRWLNMHKNVNVKLRGLITNYRYRLDKERMQCLDQATYQLQLLKDHIKGAEYEAKTMFYLNQMMKGKRLLGSKYPAKESNG